MKYPAFGRPCDTDTHRCILRSETHCSDLSDADEAAASLHGKNVNIFCAHPASKKNQAGSRSAFVSPTHELNTHSVILCKCSQYLMCLGV